MKICIDAFDGGNAPLHNFGDMPKPPKLSHDVPKLLRKIMESARLKTQTDLAVRLGRGITQPQVSRWMKGSEPEAPNYERIVQVAEELGVIGDVRSEDVAAALPSPSGPARVKLKGYVGAGSEMHFYALADEEYDEVPAPRSATDRTVAVEIKGNSMGPHLVSWLVFYDDIHSPVADALIGQLCVVGLADDRILIKKIQRGRNGAYRLLSNNPDEPDIEDAQIEWAAKVSSMEPR